MGARRSAATRGPWSCRTRSPPHSRVASAPTHDDTPAVAGDFTHGQSLLAQRFELVGLHDSVSLRVGFPARLPLLDRRNGLVRLAGKTHRKLVGVLYHGHGSSEIER